ncbi:MAG: RES family NAD+ phosphorylase [Blastocatellia bacterium]
MIDFSKLSQNALQNLLAPYTKPLSGTWYRAIQLKFIATALQYAHTGTQTSRFGAGTPAAPAHQLLYLAENQQLALLEVGAFFSPPGSGTIVPNPANAWAVLNVTVTLSNLADLTDPNAQQVLETTAQELTGDWIGYQLRALPGATIKTPTGIAPTQELGAQLYGIPGFEGFLTVSAKSPDRKNLVIYPNKIRTPSQSSVSFSHPHTGVVHSIP